MDWHCQEKVLLAYVMSHFTQILNSNIGHKKCKTSKSINKEKKIVSDLWLFLSWKSAFIYASSLFGASKEEYIKEKQFDFIRQIDIKCKPNIEVRASLSYLGKIALTLSA